MKKLIVVIGLTVMLMLAAPLTVLAASFTWNVNVTNSTSTAYTNTSFTAPISTSSWISSNYIQSNGLDVQIMDGTTALPTEVTDTGLWWVGSIAKNTTKTFTLSTGNTPATSMPIIVGTGGYVTIPYNADLNLEGMSFSKSITGYFNAKVGSNENLYTRVDAFQVYESATVAGTIAAHLIDGPDSVTVTISGVPSGLATITTSLADGILTLTATPSGSSPITNSTAFLGSIPNTVEDEILDSGNVFSYITSYSESLGGSQLILYQPNTIILGTTLPNCDSGSYPATITFGTNPSGISCSVGQFAVIKTATAPIVTGGGSPTSSYPGGMPPLTAEGGYQPFPGADVIEHCLNSSDIPLDCSGISFICWNTRARLGHDGLD